MKKDNILTNEEWKQLRNRSPEPKKFNGKKIIVFLAPIVASVLFIVIGHHIFSGYNTESYDNLEVYKAKIISIDHIEENERYAGSVEKTITFTAKITSGPEKGTLVSSAQVIDSMLVMQDKEVRKGDSILVSYTNFTASGQYEWLFAGYNRVDALLLLCGVFLVLVVIIGRKKGINTIISLVVTCLIIFFVYIPSILSGFNVYLSTFIVSLAIILSSLILINGADKKTLCAILGNLGGVLIAALLALLMNHIMKMTGFVDEQYALLSFANADQPLNLIAIMWGGMVLGSLGAIMDVAMSIASAMHELAEHMQDRSFKKMLRSGMNIGRDAIGTMTNTLILAYIGSSLALVLLLIVNTKNTLFLFSMEMVAVEVVQAITGSLGILFAVPFTAVFAAYLYNKKKVSSIN